MGGDFFIRFLFFCFFFGLYFPQRLSITLHQRSFLCPATCHCLFSILAYVSSASFSLRLSFPFDHATSPVYSTLPGCHQSQIVLLSKMLSLCFTLLHFAYPPLNTSTLSLAIPSSRIFCLSFSHNLLCLKSQTPITITYIRQKKQRVVVVPILLKFIYSH